MFDGIDFCLVFVAERLVIGVDGFDGRFIRCLECAWVGRQGLDGGAHAVDCGVGLSRECAGGVTATLLRSIISLCEAGRKT